MLKRNTIKQGFNHIVIAVMAIVARFEGRWEPATVNFPGSGSARYRIRPGKDGSPGSEMPAGWSWKFFSTQKGQRKGHFEEKMCCFVSRVGSYCSGSRAAPHKASSCDNGTRYSGPGHSFHAGLAGVKKLFCKAPQKAKVCSLPHHTIRVPFSSGGLQSQSPGRRKYRVGRDEAMMGINWICYGVKDLCLEDADRCRKKRKRSVLDADFGLEDDAGIVQTGRRKRQRKVVAGRKAGTNRGLYRVVGGVEGLRPRGTKRKRY